MRHWLMKSEPQAYSIDDLARDKKTLWTGVRNFQARNLMTDDMKVGDPVIFYHSSSDPSGVAGLGKISKAAVADPTQFDEKSDYYEPRATKETPVWRCVEVKFVKKAKAILPLDALRKEKALDGMVLLQRGSRLSVQPVEPAAFARIVELAGL
jgi:predicted RNA-binding protein with PUA-like domain